MLSLLGRLLKVIRKKVNVTLNYLNNLTFATHNEKDIDKQNETVEPIPCEQLLNQSPEYWKGYLDANWSLNNEEKIELEHIITCYLLSHERKNTE